jgi:uncharacterized membrane protein YvbJ
MKMCKECKAEYNEKVIFCEQCGAKMPVKTQFLYVNKSDYPLIARALKFFLKEKNLRKGSSERHSLEHIIEDFERKV